MIGSGFRGSGVQEFWVQRSALLPPKKTAGQIEKETLKKRISNDE